MFGVKQRDHENRYKYGQEWIDSIKMMWSDAEDFDFDGEFIKLRAVRAKLKPHGGSRPLLMNAGASPVGRAFAMRNCDAFFTKAPRDSFDVLKKAHRDNQDGIATVRPRTRCLYGRRHHVPFDKG
jgi:FMNH2-dependent dimethyl sulfone monooxygenase